MEKTPVGIMSIASYLPEAKLSGREIANRSGIPEHVVTEKMGIKEKTIPGSEDHPAQMGIWAAQKALKQASIGPEEIDLIIYIGEEYKEYSLWTASIYIQEQINASNAVAFDTSLRCGTTVMAMDVAKAMMLTHAHINTVLLAGGYRNGDFIHYDNPRSRFMYNLAAGGGAMIMRKGLSKNILLETEMITDGSFSKDVLRKNGGSLEWAKPSGNPFRDQLDVTDPEGMKKRLAEKSMQNFLHVIRQSLKKSGRSEADIDYLAILHMKRSAHDYVLAELGLKDSQAIYLNKVGHVGQFDQIISVEQALLEKKIREGSTVCMVSAGIGYAWVANTIQWGNGR